MYNKKRHVELYNRINLDN